MKSGDDDRGTRRIYKTRELLPVRSIPVSCRCCYSSLLLLSVYGLIFHNRNRATNHFFFSSSSSIDLPLIIAVMKQRTRRRTRFQDQFYLLRCLFLEFSHQCEPSFENERAFQASVIAPYILPLGQSIFSSRYRLIRGVPRNEKY